MHIKFPTASLFYSTKFGEAQSHFQCLWFISPRPAFFSFFLFKILPIVECTAKNTTARKERETSKWKPRAAGVYYVVVGRKNRGSSLVMENSAWPAFGRDSRCDARDECPADPLPYIYYIVTYLCEVLQQHLYLCFHVLYVCVSTILHVYRASLYIVLQYTHRVMVYV